MKNSNGARRVLKAIPVTVYLLIGIIALFAAIAGPAKYLKISNIMNVLTQCATGVGIVSLASFIAIVSTDVDLSLGAIVSMTGMICAKMLTWDNPALNGLRESAPGVLLIIAILCAVASGAVMGGVNGLILSRTKIPSFIVTLGVAKICETFSRVIAGGSTIRVSGMPAFEFLGGGSLLSVQQAVQNGARVSYRTIGVLPICVLVMLALYALMSVILKRTRFGTYMYAMGGNYDAAELSGINTTRTRFLVFVYGGMIAAVAGILLTSKLTSASAANGMGTEFEGIAAAVVGGAALTGGRSTPWRTLIGALIIAVLSNGFSMVGMSNSLQMISVGAVLIVVVAFDALKNKGR